MYLFQTIQIYEFNRFIPRKLIRRIPRIRTSQRINTQKLPDPAIVNTETIIINSPNLAARHIIVHLLAVEPIAVIFAGVVPAGH